MPFCPICNTPVSIDALECVNCGAHFGTDSELRPREISAAYQYQAKPSDQHKSVSGGFAKYLLTFVGLGLAVLAYHVYDSTFFTKTLSTKHAYVLPHEPLSPQEFDRVLADLKPWRGFGYQSSYKHKFTAVTRESLARFLVTPKFHDLEVDQQNDIRELALMMGAVEFRSLDDVWRKYRGNEAGYKTLSVESRSPTTNWSTVGVAYRAFFVCLPKDVWTFEKPKTYYEDWGIESTKECVTQAVKRQPAPDTDKLQFSDGMPWLDDDPYKGDAALFIEDMLVSILQERQCRGSGPNNCIYLSLVLSELAPSSHKAAKALKLVDTLVQVDHSLDMSASPPPSLEKIPSPPQLKMLQSKKYKLSAPTFTHPLDDYLRSIFFRYVFWVQNYRRNWLPHPIGRKMLG